MIARLSPADAYGLVTRGTHELVDVREPHEWAAGRIPGARHVPLRALAAAPHEHLHGERPVIFVCAHGARSQTACMLALRAGLSDAASIDGGTVRWAAEGLPFEGVT
jgi:rhodanese-related sulfurtransferase